MHRSSACPSVPWLTHGIKRQTAPGLQAIRWPSTGRLSIRSLLLAFHPQFYRWLSVQTVESPFGGRSAFLEKSLKNCLKSVLYLVSEQNADLHLSPPHPSNCLCNGTCSCSASGYVSVNLQNDMIDIRNYQGRLDTRDMCLQVHRGVLSKHPGRCRVWQQFPHGYFSRPCTSDPAGLLSYVELLVIITIYRLSNMM